MAFLNIFKKDKPEKKAVIEKETGKKEIKKEKKPEKKDEVKEEIIAPQIPGRKMPGIAFGILKHPHVTEKATDLAEEGKYVFLVQKSANKPQVKKAVENTYGINVVKVRIINVPPKKRRMGKQEGWRKGYKKAIVEVKKGQKIEILPR